MNATAQVETTANLEAVKAKQNAAWTSGDYAKIGVTLQIVGEELADRYGVVSYPTIVLMDASGREIARSRGAKRPGEFLRWLERSLEEARARAGGDDDTYVM